MKWLSILKFINNCLLAILSYLVTTKDFSYPVEGWYWFDTIEEAYSFYGKELIV